jgi:hypothetical protein
MRTCAHFYNVLRAVQATTEDAAFHVLNVQKYGGFILHTGQAGYGTLKVKTCPCLPHASFGQVFESCVSEAYKFCKALLLHSCSKSADS